ncbi:MAG: potassium transporter TrkG [Pseudomonadota bacterium]
MPVLVIMACIGTLSMLPVSFHAAVHDDYAVARPFFYGGIVLTGVCVLVGIAARSWRIRKPVRAMLLTIVGCYLVLPLLLALPLVETVPGLNLLGGYFEMMSSLTTTGATLLDDPAAVAPSVHLWRALVGWWGGLIAWVSAIAIFAPMRLGGFEVLANRVEHSQTGAEYYERSELRERLTRHSADLVPIYAGLTFLLWVLLLMAGEDPFVALCHAMSTLATSGITPLAGFEQASAGRIGEMLLAFFFVFALLRRTFARDMSSNTSLPIWREAELRVAFFIVVGLTLILILRHWLALDASSIGSEATLGEAAWGGFFTTLSFLSTTGFASADWVDAQAWAGLSAPGLILMGLALVGGGVATTAGGVKLLRVYILYKHGSREMARLVHPSSVASIGGGSRTILPQNAVIAWVYFMTFGLTIGAVMMALTALGIGFEEAAILAVATLSTTGPLIDVAGQGTISEQSLPGAAQIVLCVAMVLGRLGTLTLVALLNPGFWRV